jgi:predicted dehydrogenase
MSRSTRREFLDEAFFAAALGGAALLLPRPARAARPRPVAEGRVRLGVVGVRGRGLDHIKGYLNLPDAEIVAVCDIDESMAARAAELVEKKTGTRPEVFSDLRKLLERKDIDAVSLALPIHWHALAASWAMLAGKDVYVEKPCSHNVSEGRRLVEIQRRTGRICQVGTQSRSHRAIQDAMAYVHGGKIGKVTLSRGLCYKPRKSIGIKPDAPVPAGVDYDLWLGPAPVRPFNPNRFHYEWHWSFDYGAGDLGNQGIHQMDLARWALQKTELPRTVQSVGGRFGYVDQGETPNTLAVVYDWPDAKLIFEVRGLNTPPLSGASIGNIIYGESGYVVLTASYDRAAAFDLAGNKVQEFTGSGDHFTAFLRAVKSRKQSDLAAPVLEGHLSSALCHLGNVSYKLGQKADVSEAKRTWSRDEKALDALVRMESHLKTDGNGAEADIERFDVTLGKKLTLDNKKEQFQRDRDANKLLTRAYRAGFELPK